jgi:hypothetical protein
MRLRLALGLLVTLLVLAAGSPASAADGDGDGVRNAQDRCPTIRGALADGCPVGKWRLRNANSAGPAGASFNFSSIANVPLTGDWDGDGDDTVGTYNAKNGVWSLSGAPSGGAGLSFTYRPLPDLQPIVGDWDGNGTDTPGLYWPTNGVFYLRNSNSTGGVDVTLAFGGPQPAAQVRAVAGDWDGDDIHTVGLYRRDSNQWRLRNTNTTGGADLTYSFGSTTTQRPVVGDWNDDGTETAGLMSPAGSWRLRNTNVAISGALAFTFASSGGPVPIAGDWNADGQDTIGIRRR